MKNGCELGARRRPDDEGKIVQRWMSEGEAIVDGLLDSGDMGKILGTLEQLSTSFYIYSPGAVRLAAYIAQHGSVDNMIAAMHCFDEDASDIDAVDTDGGRILAEAIVRTGDKDKMLEALSGFDELSPIRQRILVIGIIDPEDASTRQVIFPLIERTSGEFIAEKLREVMSIVDETRKEIEGGVSEE